LNVEANSGFIQQQQSRLMQQGAGDFDASHLAARKVAHLVLDARFHLYRMQYGFDALAGLCPPKTVQRRMVGEVLAHAQIEIKRARLKYDADAAESLAGLTADIVVEDADRPGLDRKEAAYQREKRCFASAVQAQQNCDAARRYGKAHIRERAMAAIGMADASNVDRCGFASAGAWMHVLHSVLPPIAHGLLPLRSGSSVLVR